jgi:putative ABC transport system ATP-binding protein
MQYAIQTEHLVKVYGAGETRVEAIKGIDLAVMPGELLAITGPSGSGKTTLLSILGLGTEPTEGRLLLDGKNIYPGSRRDLERRRRESVGFIFQFANLIPFLTAGENVLWPMTLIGITGARAQKRVLELLEYLEITDRASHYPEQLSGGEKQRVAIARALANDPRIILADEPTASLDVDRGLAVMRLLRRLSREQRKAILVVTHDTRMIGEVDRVVRMSDGRMIPSPDAPGRPTA